MTESLKSSHDSKRRRYQGEQGATVVEYSLVAVVTVISFAIIGSFLEKTARDRANLSMGSVKSIAPCVLNEERTENRGVLEPDECL
jgi:Flp pilus assembly pilin Flp